MPTQSTSQSIPYQSLIVWLSGTDKGKTDTFSTGSSPTSKRSRSWFSQGKGPYVLTLPYTDVKTVWDVNAYSYVRQQKDAGYATWYNRYMVTCPCTPVQANDLDWIEKHSMASTTTAKNRCLEETGGITWNLPVFAAEVGKTSDMMFNAAKAITKGYRQARRGNFRGMLKTFGISNTPGVASNWLGYRYGVMTTLLDVQSAAQAAAETLVGRPQVQKIICRGPVIETVYAGYTTNLGMAILSLNENRFLDTHVKLETKAWLTVKVANKAILTANSFGLANPALIAWELVPLSFVADWAIGVGDWLSAQTSLLGLSVVDGGTSQLSSRTMVARTMNKTVDSHRTVMRIAPRVSGVSRKYVRSPWTGSVPPIRLGWEMSTRRFIDAAALIRGFIKSL